MINSLKGAVFDLDGTLVDSLFFWDYIWPLLGEKYLGNPGFRPDAEDDKVIRAMTIKSSTRLLYEKYGIGTSAEALYEEMDRIIDEFYLDRVEIKDGVVEFLDYCLSKNIKMCIASATAKRHLDIVSRKFGFDKYFEHILSCADIGKEKTEPDIYLFALEKLGTLIEETCVFEDSLVPFRTASNAGFKTVIIYDRYNIGQEEMRQGAAEYIGEGETLRKLIK